MEHRQGQLANAYLQVHAILQHSLGGIANVLFVEVDAERVAQGVQRVLLVLTCKQEGFVRGMR